MIELAVFIVAGTLACWHAARCQRKSDKLWKEIRKLGDPRYRKGDD